jgi:nicotinamidase-related amidase
MFESDFIRQEISAGRAAVFIIDLMAATDKADKNLCPERETLAVDALSLAAQCRGHLPIVHVGTGFADGAHIYTPEFLARYGAENVLMNPMLGPQAPFLYDIPPGDFVMIKTAYSLFHERSLVDMNEAMTPDFFMRKQGWTTAVICGVYGDKCVGASARDAGFFGYATVLLPGLIRSLQREPMDFKKLGMCFAAGQVAENFMPPARPITQCSIEAPSRMPV